jgi:hypothetical protein
MIGMHVFCFDPLVILTVGLAVMCVEARGVGMQLYSWSWFALIIGCILCGVHVCCMVSRVQQTRKHSSNAAWHCTALDNYNVWASLQLATASGLCSAWHVWCGVYLSLWRLSHPCGYAGLQLQLGIKSGDTECCNWVYLHCQPAWVACSLQ